MAKLTDVEQLSQMVSNELTKDSTVLGKQLFPEIVQPGEVMKQPEFLSMVASQWSDPKYRQSVLGDIGPKAFLSLAQDALDHIGKTSIAAVGGPPGAVPMGQPGATPPPTPQILGELQRAGIVPPSGAPMGAAPAPAAPPMQPATGTAPSPQVLQELMAAGIVKPPSGPGVSGGP